MPNRLDAPRTALYQRGKTDILGDSAGAPQCRLHVAAQIGLDELENRMPLRICGRPGDVVGIKREHQIRSGVVDGSLQYEALRLGWSDAQKIEYPRGLFGLGAVEWLSRAACSRAAVPVARPRWARTGGRSRYWRHSHRRSETWLRVPRRRPKDRRGRQISAGFRRAQCSHSWFFYACPLPGIGRLALLRLC